jgi:5'-nucleotidase
MRPLILISNDDGYHAKGINSLIDMISDLGDILVCAPESARSGFSTAFSATIPLRLKLRREREGMQMWSCNGTPVDCVKLALSELCNGRKPDIVIGGINHGDNASVNSHYSGTMGVVREGCMKYIPSVAFSLCNHEDDADFEPLRKCVRAIVSSVLRDGLPKGVCLNVNFPLLKEFKGIKVCRMANGTWGNEVVRAHHPRGYDYFWLVGEYTNDEPEADDTDNWALRHGYVAITPTTIDVTAYEMIEKIKNIISMHNSQSGNS